MSFQGDLESVFARNGLKLISWSYPKRKNRMHLCFLRESGKYFILAASIRPWKTPEQHDKLFLSSVERELNRRIRKERKP